MEDSFIMESGGITFYWGGYSSMSDKIKDVFGSHPVVKKILITDFIDNKELNECKINFKIQFGESDGNKEKYENLKHTKVIIGEE